MSTNHRRKTSNKFVWCTALGEETFAGDVKNLTSSCPAPDSVGADVLKLSRLWGLPFVANLLVLPITSHVDYEVYFTNHACVRSHY